MASTAPIPPVSNSFADNKPYEGHHATTTPSNMGQSPGDPYFETGIYNPDPAVASAAHAAFGRMKCHHYMTAQPYYNVEEETTRFALLSKVCVDPGGLQRRLALHRNHWLTLENS